MTLLKVFPSGNDARARKQFCRCRPCNHAQNAPKHHFHRFGVDPGKSKIEHLDVLKNNLSYLGPNRWRELRRFGKLRHKRQKTKNIYDKRLKKRTTQMINAFFMGKIDELSFIAVCRLLKQRKVVYCRLLEPHAQKTIIINVFAINANKRP